MSLITQLHPYVTQVGKSPLVGNEPQTTEEGSLVGIPTGRRHGWTCTVSILDSAVSQGLQIS